MNKQDIEFYQNKLDDFLKEKNNYPKSKYHGKGIVMCGGGERYFPNAWISIKLLRFHGCTLPIELWYLGKREMNESLKTLVRPLDVTCIDAFDIAKKHPVKKLGGWELKPYAIIHSRFEEVLFMDADNFVTKDPTYLFNSEPYLETGAIFWPDLYNQVTKEPLLRREVWEICKTPFRDEPEFETGQMVIHKEKTWEALQLTMYFNEHSDFYYKYFYGDKDTFHLAWRKCYLPYSLVPHPPKLLVHNWAIIQSDFQGYKIFQHRCGAKWVLHGENLKVPGFQFEKECTHFLKELKNKWSGKILNLPADFSKKEKETFDLICKEQKMEATVPYQENIVLLFQEDFKLTSTSKYFTGTWSLMDNKDGVPELTLKLINLTLKKLDRPYTFRCKLQRSESGEWRGYWNRFLGIEAVLSPSVRSKVLVE